MIVNITEQELISIRNNGRIVYSEETIIELDSECYLERFILQDPINIEFYCYWAVNDQHIERTISNGGVKSISREAINNFYVNLPDEIRSDLANN